MKQFAENILSFLLKMINKYTINPFFYNLFLNYKKL